MKKKKTQGWVHSLHNISCCRDFSTTSHETNPFLPSITTLFSRQKQCKSQRIKATGTFRRVVAASADTQVLGIKKRWQGRCRSWRWCILSGWCSLGGGNSSRSCLGVDCISASCIYFLILVTVLPFLPRVPAKWWSGECEFGWVSELSTRTRVFVLYCSSSSLLSALTRNHSTVWVFQTHGNQLDWTHLGVWKNHLSKCPWWCLLGTSNLLIATFGRAAGSRRRCLRLEEAAVMLLSTSFFNIWATTPRYIVDQLQHDVCGLLCCLRFCFVLWKKKWGTTYWYPILEEEVPTSLASCERHTYKSDKRQLRYHTSDKNVTRYETCW